MRNQDLIAVAAKCRVVTRFRNTIGLPGPPVRAAAAQPSDRRPRRGIAASIARRPALWRGDAVIGINPASDSVAGRHRACSTARRDLRQRFDIPTQILRADPCHHHARGDRARRAGRSRLPVDRRHARPPTQASASILALLREAREAALSLKRGTVGDNVMYFETGQGSALSADAHHGVDQQTLEARAYAVARAFPPLLVNTVVGFIGPEYLYDGKQIIRAGLEDHFCGKLLGLPMGCDVCYTNHAEADQDDMDVLDAAARHPRLVGSVTAGNRAASPIMCPIHRRCSAKEMDSRACGPAAIQARLFDPIGSGCTGTHQTRARGRSRYLLNE